MSRELKMAGRNATVNAVGLLLSAILLTACPGTAGTSRASPGASTSDVDECEPIPSKSAVSGFQPGEIRVTKAGVSSLQDVVRVLGDAGFPNLVVLRLGVPTEVQLALESDRELIARTAYRLPDGNIVEVLQTCATHIPAVGRAVRIRGADGIRDGETVRWVERGYLLGVSPGKTEYARALTWQKATVS
ncbi:MAG: hypothetical protein ACXWXM_08100 [Actinomycetota bacterium]